MLTITLITAGILGLMFVWLSVRVIQGRVKDDVLIGDQGHIGLEFLIRTHGNFTEFTPLFLILLGLNEMAGAAAGWLVSLAALFVLARFSHVAGMSEGANLKFRQAGIAGSFTAIILSSFSGFYLALF